MAYLALKAELEQCNAELVAVSKTKPAGEILKLYDLGQRIFGENRVQELVEKQALLPKDISWHMIGHLQRNKVKYIASFVDMIESVDSMKLLKEINKQAKKHNRLIPVLLEFHIASEASKSGFTMEEIEDLLGSEELKSMTNVKIEGVMGMATFTSDQEHVRSEFSTLKSIFDRLKEDYFEAHEDFKIISMGMSGDYKIALEEGSNMVRIGSLLFGARN